MNDFLFLFVKRQLNEHKHLYRNHIKKSLFAIVDIKNSVGCQ